MNKQNSLQGFSLAIFFLFAFCIFSTTTSNQSLWAGSNLQQLAEDSKDKAKELVSKGKDNLEKKFNAVMEDEDQKNFLIKIGMLLGFGGITGFVAGYSIKKMIKVFMVVIGLFFIILQGMSYGGFITINWEKVKNTIWPFFQNREFIEHAKTILTNQFPYASGFGGGFYLGMKKG